MTGEGELDEEETALLTLRDHLFAIAQNREEPINQRMEQILSACGAHVPDVPLAQWAEFYLSLERMDEAWTGILEALREHADELPLDDFAAHMKGRETEYEQLLIYFLYRHVSTALDDGDVSSKAALRVLSVRLLFALGALRSCCTASLRWRIRSSSAGCQRGSRPVPTIIWTRSSTRCYNENAARFDTGRHFLRFLVDSYVNLWYHKKTFFKSGRFRPIPAKGENEMKQNMRKRTPLAVLLALCLAMQLCVPAAMASNRLMRAGDAAIEQIEEEEGFRAEKYSSGGKWYIGYGAEPRCRGLSRGHHA